MENSSLSGRQLAAVSPSEWDLAALVCSSAVDTFLRLASSSSLSGPTQSTRVVGKVHSMEQKYTFPGGPHSTACNGILSGRGQAGITQTQLQTAGLLEEPALGRQIPSRSDLL